jgi:hypothetical protein
VSDRCQLAPNRVAENVPGREKTKDRIKKGMMKANLSSQVDDRMPAHHSAMKERSPFSWSLLPNYDRDETFSYFLTRNSDNR